MQANTDDAGIDVYDISRLVEQVTASSPLLPWPLEGFTNGKSFFFNADQVADIAAAMPGGELTRGSAGEWLESVAGKGMRVLAERHINGGTFYRFRKYWEFQPISG